jgi:hypothetical protein
MTEEPRPRERKGLEALHRVCSRQVEAAVVGRSGAVQRDGGLYIVWCLGQNGFIGDITRKARRLDKVEGTGGDTGVDVDVDVEGASLVGTLAEAGTTQPAGDCQKTSSCLVEGALRQLLPTLQFLAATLSDAVFFIAFISARDDQPSHTTLLQSLDSHTHTHTHTQETTSKTCPNATVETGENPRWVD